MPSYARPKKPFVVLPDGCLDTWNAAKASSATAAARIMLLGDSLGEGNNATSRFTQGFWPLIRQSLTGATGASIGSGTPYLLGGDFWTPGASIAGDGLYGTPVPFTLFGSGGTVYVFFTNGFGRIPYWSVAPATPIMSFLTPYSCTEIDIHYLDVGTGSWTYHLDAESAGTRTCTLTNTNLPNVIKITGLTSATHTLTFDTQSGANVMAINGVSTFPTVARRTTGLQFAWIANGGLELSCFGPPPPALGTAGYGMSDPPAIFSGRYGGVVSGVSVANPPVITMSPAQAVIPPAGTYCTFSGLGGAVGTFLNNQSAALAVPTPMFMVAASPAPTSTTFTIQTQAGASPGSAGTFTTGGQVQFHTGLGFPYQAHLVLLELTGGGDCIWQRGFEAFEEVYRRVVTAIWRGGATPPATPPSILVCAGSAEWPTTADNTAVIPYAEMFHVYGDIAAGVAGQYHLGWVDLLSYFNQNQVSSTYYTTGDFHPNTAGHAQLANIFKSIPL